MAKPKTQRCVRGRGFLGSVGAVRAACPTTFLRRVVLVDLAQRRRQLAPPRRPVAQRGLIHAALRTRVEATGSLEPSPRGPATAPPYPPSIVGPRTIHPAFSWWTSDHPPTPLRRWAKDYTPSLRLADQRPPPLPPSAAEPRTIHPAFSSRTSDHPPYPTYRFPPLTKDARSSHL